LPKQFKESSILLYSKNWKVDICKYYRQKTFDNMKKMEFSLIVSIEKEGIKIG